MAVGFNRSSVSRVAACTMGLVLLSVSAACGSENNDVLSCTVHSVHDGDSMRVRCSARHDSVRLRLDQIDAPEIDQSYGKSARDHLRKLCPKGDKVTIKVHGRDQYGRLLGDAQCKGRNVSEELVAAGSAWAYKRHVRDPLLTRLERGRGAPAVGCGLKEMQSRPGSGGITTGRATDVS